MENKILSIQFEPPCAKQTCPSYSDGMDQDEAETQNDSLCSQEWCNCKKCEKMATSLECPCCHKILEVKAFHLKNKATSFWNTAVLKFFCKLCAK